MKNGNIYKAVSISNQENLTNNSPIYNTMKSIIDEQRYKYGQGRDK